MHFSLKKKTEQTYLPDDNSSEQTPVKTFQNTQKQQFKQKKSHTPLV